jgi:hypothetical protein
LLFLTFTVNNFVFTIYAVIASVISPIHPIKTVPYVCHLICKLPALAFQTPIITDLVLYVFFQIIHKIWAVALQRSWQVM